MNINDTFIHFPINQGGVTFSVVGHSGDGCILGPTLEIKSQANGHTLGFNSIHIHPSSLRLLGEYLVAEANHYEEMINEECATLHPLAVTATSLNFENKSDE